MLEKMYNLDNLYDSFQCVKKASGWKQTTQLYNEDLMFNLISLKNSLANGTYRPTEPYKFILSERGKTRCISSYCINDRIVQNCFMNNILMPTCQPKLIYENCASIKGKGTDFFRRILMRNLINFWRNHGTGGYILLCDLSKYFDNIQHDIWLKNLSDLGIDDECIDFARLLLSNQIVDVSYMTNDEYANCMNAVFNSVEYFNRKSPKTGEKMMAKGIDIGAPIAQGAGITHLYKLDSLCKIVLRHKYYARYQDDFYVIHEDKDYLKYTLDRIKKQCKELGVFINEKKTQIVKLTHKFTLLKTQYLVTDTGILTFPCKSTFRQEKSHIKELFQDERVTIPKIYSMYGSWRGGVSKRFGECTSLSNMDEYVRGILESEVK